MLHLYCWTFNLVCGFLTRVQSVRFIMVSETRCKEILNGFPCDGDLIILGEYEDELICCASEVGISAFIIEKENEAEACKKHLIKKGIKKFESFELTKKYYGFDNDVKVSIEE